MRGGDRSSAAATAPPDRRRPPLSRELILRRALAMIDADGVEKLSVRKLAADLGVFPTALYYYLPNRHAVLRGVVELVLADLELPASHGTGWRQRVTAICHSLRRVAHAHPRFFPYLIAYPESTVQEHGIYEELYGALTDAGLTPTQVVHAGNLIFAFASGFALAEVNESIGPLTREELAALSALPADRFPVTRRLSPEIGTLDLDASFTSGLDTILAGLAAGRS